MKGADVASGQVCRCSGSTQRADTSSSFSLQTSAGNKCRPLSASVCTQCTSTFSSCMDTHCCGGKRGQCLQAMRFMLQLKGRWARCPSLHCSL